MRTPEKILIEKMKQHNCNIQLENTLPAPWKALISQENEREKNKKKLKKESAKARAVGRARLLRRGPGETAAPARSPRSEERRVGKEC